MSSGNVAVCGHVAYPLVLYYLWYEDGRPLTRGRFVEALRKGLGEAGISQKDYCSHSFRIGAATTAAARGVEDAVIKTLGRWESLAYLRYVKIPRAELASYTRILAAD